MRKFWILFEKEVKELLTLRMVLPLVVMTVLFAFIGGLISSEQEKVEEPLSFHVIDQDESKFSNELLDHLGSTGVNGEGLEGVEVEQGIAEAKKEGALALMVIPEGFQEDFFDFKQPKIEIYTFYRGLSFISTMETSKVDRLKVQINEFLSNRLILANLPDADPGVLKNPSEISDFLIINDKQANVGFNQVVGFIQSQTTFVPILLFLIIVLASQMVAITIANEKENKTFEILLSSPINRKVIVLSKILASGFVALIFMLFYMFGFKYYMGSFMGDAMVMGDEIQEALKQLGVMITAYGYVLIGLSLFLAILSALVVAIILGVMAEDVKSVQMVITPLMILILIPYFITMFLNLESMALILKILIYAIPFSYPFLAMQKVLTSEFSFVIWGLLYQVIVFGILVVVASKVFSSEKILTFRLSFKKRKIEEA